MKKNLLIAALVLGAMLMSEAGKAQAVKGKNFLNAGIGIGSFGLNGTGGLPITASFEHGFSDKISGGVFVGIVSRNYTSSYKYKYFVVGARASYHFNEVLKITNPKVDVYGGASIYYRGYSLNYDYLGTKQKVTDGTVGIALHAAARYMFSTHVGGYAELGYGISPLQLGVTFIF
jgi:hypothetical protein